MALRETRRTARMCPTRAAKSTQVNIRIEPQRLATIDAGAEARERNRTGFMVETARRAAEAVLPGKRFYAADDGSCRRFLNRLDA